MLEANVGDVKYFREMGNVYRVQVLEVEERVYGTSEGHEYTLRMLGVMRTGRFFRESSHPKEGEEFNVWKAKKGGGQAGWSLSDH